MKKLTVIIKDERGKVVFEAKAEHVSYTQQRGILRERRIGEMKMKIKPNGHMRGEIQFWTGSERYDGFVDNTEHTRM